MVAKEFWKGDSVSFLFLLLCPTLTLTHYFTYHSFSILVRPARTVTAEKKTGEATFPFTRF
jgi:hypothetical protein